MRIAIIEDELPTARDLSTIVKTIEPDAEVLPFLFSVEEAVEFFKQKPDLDLIFSDIELGDGLSFEIFQATSIQTPVIFCTAYQQYTLDAFRNYGIDYVLKPFDKAAIGKALEKYQKLKEKFTRQDTVYKELKTLLSHRNQGERSIIVHQGDKILPVRITDIAFFQIMEETVYAITFSKDRYVVNQKLDYLQEEVPDFFRANRQYLLNRVAVKGATQYFNRKLLIDLVFPHEDKIIVSRLKASRFIDWLSNNPGSV